MPSLLLIVFVLTVVIHLVNTLGAATINELLWVLYNKLPTPTSQSVQKQNRLRLDLIRLRTSLSNVSAQDDFARWAKLDRQHTKAKAEYDKTSTSLQTHRAQFDTTVSTLRWLGTAGLRFVLQWWYAKQPLFWIPQGWLPYYVEWILSFPRAPLGSVSIQVWGIACASVVQLVAEAIGATWVIRRKRSGAGAGKEKMVFKSGSGENKNGKKEL